MSFDSLVNKGDYFSAHYLAEVLPKDLKRKDGLFARWTAEEKDGRLTPRKGLRALGKPYFADRPYFAGLDAKIRNGEALDPDELAERRKALHELHGEILRALGYEARPHELTVERAGSDEPYTVPVAYAHRHLVAIECGWATDVDAALDDEQAGLLLQPVDDGSKDGITSGTKLATWLFSCEEPPRYVLILAGGVLVLADRATWGEGRYLGVSLDIALGRNNPDELATIAALFGADSLLPPEEGGSEVLTELLEASRNHAVGVSKELRDGLKESVELIANEVLARIREHGVQPEQLKDPSELAKELTRESLRYLYRILFLLYAEARPELGILPVKDKDYIQGYSMARLGDLVVRDVVGEEARHGFHLYESLDLLFRMVNKGHRPRTGEETSDGEGLRFEPLRSELFEPEAIKLIGKQAFTMPGYDEDDPDAPKIDTRLRNETLHQVLRKLMLAKGRKKERGGFISYAQLGINQLGAVYEGLMSYTGFIATEELYEVAKNGDPKDGSWLIPASKVDEYPSEVFVRRVDEDGNKTDEFVRYEKGSFVYRLAGRDRETSASYYTPESLTKVTVQLALQHRLDQNGERTSAREILGWKICEPALGSGAFLNEAINQVAAEYLKRRQEELGQTIDPERYEQELQKVKAYIALHNCYGVDLNDTAVELAEISIWLNVMHPGLQAPWFGLHLRRGNSLIGAGRRVYDAAQLTKGEWLKTAPEDIPFSAGPIPEGKVHHFLVPAEGWGAVAGAKEAKELAPEKVKQLAAWRKKIRARVSDKGNARKPSQLQRLQDLARRVEYLWDLVVQRLTISEREISRKIDVWGADWIEQPTQAVPKEKVLQDLTAPGTPYWRLKKVMDTWCALWFWPLDRVGLLDGTDEVYQRQNAFKGELTQPEPSTIKTDRFSAESIGFKPVYKTDTLFETGEPQQIGLDEAAGGLGSIDGTGSTRKGVSGSARKRLTSEQARQVIPLAGLDDWLDFTEAVLGRVDIPEDSLGAEFTSLADLEEHEDQLPAWMGMDSPLKLSERFPWLDVIDDLAFHHIFFHWELQLAQVFYKGGFDLQVGNPPWVRPDWLEGAVLAELDPWFKLTDKPAISEWRSRKSAVLLAKNAQSYYLKELAANAGAVEFLGSGVTYPLLAGTRPDLYRAFMCRVWINLGERGIAGLVHPDSHFNGVREGRLRAASYHHLRFHAHFHNRRGIFKEIHANTEFGVNVYGRWESVDFCHMSWLFDPLTLSGSLIHDGSGELPGIKYQGEWDVRPHRDRIVRVDEDVLAKWKGLGSLVDSVDQTPLLYPVTVLEMEAIEVLSRYRLRIADCRPHISIGYNEGQAKKQGLIKWINDRPKAWYGVVLQGPHISHANPYGKQPKVPCKTNRDWVPWDLRELPVDAVPVTNYGPCSDDVSYFAAQDLWSIGGRSQKYTDYYRLAWRDMIPFDTERSLFAALIPPGPAHVHAIRSMALANNRCTSLAAGFWASLPLDYLMRITGRAHLSVAEANWMPAADEEHPLAEPLLVRALRLNCLSSAYSSLWEELYKPSWQYEQWVVDWPGIPPLAGSDTVGPKWTHATPLRTERERRAALVELDALVALWLGMSADQLVAIYRSRYPVLADYEAQTWFDANGRKIAGNHNAYGYGQTKEHFEQLMAHLDPEVNAPPPEGYTPPFYKADREAEYRQAHAVFSERLRKAQQGN